MFRFWLALALLIAPAGMAKAVDGLAGGAPETLTTLPPLEHLAHELRGGDGSPGGRRSLGAGNNAHGSALDPGAVRAVNDADLVFWVGPGLEPGIARLADEDPKFVKLGEAPGVTTRQLPNGASDPHVWLAPANALVMADAITEAYVRTDPGKAALYRANRERLGDRIEATEREWQGRLAPLSGRAYVVAHDAFGYFAEAMGLDEAIVVTAGEHADAGARRLREVIAEARERDAACLIVEPGSNGRLARTLGLREVTIDPLGTELPDYPALIEAVGRGFEECLSDAS